MPDNWKTDRGRVAALTRSRTPDDPDLIEARRSLRVARFEVQIRKLVDEAPPLSNAQRDKLALLLRGSDDATGQ